MPLPTLDWFAGVSRPETGPWHGVTQTDQFLARQHSLTTGFVNRGASIDASCYTDRRSCCCCLHEMISISVSGVAV